MNCDHANECPATCPCRPDCICRLTIKEGGTGMCHVDEVAIRAKIAADYDPENDIFGFMEQAMAGFSYVKYAKEKGESKYDLNFGELDEQQAHKARLFWDLHNARHGHYAGAAGGRYSWIITGTGLGLITVTRCGACKEELDVTDFDSW